MKVLFLYPLWTGEYKGISGYFAKKSGGTYIPYNLALLAAITEKQGHVAKIIDGELEKISLNEIAKRSKEYDTDIIVLTGMTPFYNIAIECATLLKTNNTISDIVEDPSVQPEDLADSVKNLINSTGEDSLNSTI